MMQLYLPLEGDLGASTNQCLMSCLTHHLEVRLDVQAEEAQLQRLNEPVTVPLTIRYIVTTV